LSKSIYRIEFQKIEHLVAFAAIVSKILQRMRRTGYHGSSGKNCRDLTTFSVDIFAFYKLKVRRIFTSGLFYLLRQVRS